MNYGYIFKELRHHRHRTLVNVVGIGVGIALFVAINAVSAAYQEAVSLPFKNLGADLVVQRPEKRAVDSAQAPAALRGIRLPFSNQALSPADLEKLRAIPGVEALASALLLWEFDQGGFRTILGVDPGQPSLGPIKVKDWLKEGRFPEKAGEAALEKHFAKFRQARLGGSLTIAGRPFAVVGLVEIKEGSQAAAANVYLPLASAQALVEGGLSPVNVAYLRLGDPALLGQTKAAAARELAGVAVTSSDSFLELMGGVARVSDQFALLASLVALAGAVGLIIKTMLANLGERAREIGVLKAVGWRGSDVQNQLLGEVLVQCLLGGLAGLAAGYAVSWLLGFLSIPVATPWELSLLPAFAKDTEAAAQIVRLPVRLSAGLSAGALALALASGGLAGLLVGRRTSRMRPGEILRRL